MNLHGAKGNFGWATFSWVKLLRLAERYGWQPAATTLSDSDLAWMPGGKWNGNYATNDNQIVSAADAQALGAALELALQDIPSDDVIATHRDPSGGIRILPELPQISDPDWFCGAESKAYIREFISFCRAGSFEIR
jgi:hypothetical protein